MSWVKIMTDPTPPEDGTLVEMKGMAYYLENGLDPIVLLMEIWRDFFCQ